METNKHFQGRASASTKSSPTDAWLATLRIGALGSFEVESPLGVFAARELGGVKPKQLLELLVLARGRPLSKSALAESLWGEELPKNVAATLENYVSILRRRLFGDSTEARRVIVTGHESYHLDISKIDCDLFRFEELVARATSSTASTVERSDLLEEALAVMQDRNLLEDEPYLDWAIDAREVLAASVQSAHIDAGFLALDRQQRDVAFRHAESVLRTDPMNERAVRLAIRAEVDRGYSRSALARYEAFRHMLADEWGVDPSPETEELYRRFHEQMYPGDTAREPQWTSRARAIADRDDDVALELLTALEAAFDRAESLGGLSAVLALLDDATAKFDDIVRRAFHPGE